MGPVVSVLRYFRGNGGTIEDPEAEYPNDNEAMGFGLRQAEIAQLLFDGEDLKRRQEEWEGKVFEQQLRFREYGSEKTRRLMQWLTLRRRKSTATQEKLYRAFSNYKTLERSMNDLEEAFGSSDQVTVEIYNENVDGNHHEDAEDPIPPNASADFSASNYFSTSGHPGTSTAGRDAIAIDARHVAEDTDNIRENETNIGSDKRDQSGAKVSKTTNVNGKQFRFRSKRTNAAIARHGLDKAKTVEKNGNFACFCGVICATMKAHKRHVEYKTTVGNFKCQYCSKNYFYFGYLTQHKRRTHDINNKDLAVEFGCRKCGLILVTLAKLLSHHKLTHGNWTRPSGSISGSFNAVRAPNERPRSSVFIRRSKQKFAEDKRRWTAGTFRRGRQRGNTSASTMQDGEMRIP